VAASQASWNMGKYSELRNADYGLNKGAIET
jgi:hypothetical protein